MRIHLKIVWHLKGSRGEHIGLVEELTRFTVQVIQISVLEAKDRCIGVRWCMDD